MPRQPRKKDDNFIYHVILRGNERKKSIPTETTSLNQDDNLVDTGRLLELISADRSKAIIEYMKLVSEKDDIICMDIEEADSENNGYGKLTRKILKSQQAS